MEGNLYIVLLRSQREVTSEETVTVPKIRFEVAACMHTKFICQS